MKNLIKIIFLLIIHLFILFQNCYSQFNTFQKIYGTSSLEETGNSVVQTNDNGFMIVGRGYNCLRTDQCGDTIWTGRVPTFGYCIQTTYDNNFILTSSLYPLVKFDIDGKILWLKNTFNLNSNTYYICETSDQGYILSGLEFGGVTLYPYILKTNSYGDKLWDKSFNDYKYRTVTQIVESHDYGYVFIGIDTGAYAMKIDSIGSLLWYKNYNSLMQTATSIVSLNDGFIISGNDNLLKINKTGDVIWNKTYSLGIYRETYFNSLIKTNDNGFALTGARDTTFEIDHAPLILLLKTDSSGNQLWYNLFGIQNSFNDYNSGFDVRQTNDSGFIITGIVDSNSVYGSNSMKKNLFGGDLILIKTDQTGNITTGISGNTDLANNFTLFQNYPNPFNPSTNIKFRLLKKSFTTLKVLDMVGREVIILVNQNVDSGLHEYNFNAQNLPSGIYFYKLEILNSLEENQKFTQTKKMVFLK